MANGRWQRLAARNNAELCDAVCRTHGLEPHFDAETWTSDRRTPLFYPDAISLAPEPDARSLLSRIDDSAGASVKDSFASLDLRDHGYEVLFEATWIVAEKIPALAASHWTPVVTASQFASWEHAWRGDAGPRDVLRPGVLDDDRITIIGEFDGDTVLGGAMLNHGANAVGISNVFGRDWSGAARFAAGLVPDRPLVGYESGDALTAAIETGFTNVGGLRVWTRAA